MSHCHTTNCHTPEKTILGYAARPKAERNAISVQSSTRPKAEENFARATESISDEAAGRGGNTFRSYDYVNHLVSGQLVGLQLGLGLGSGLGLGLGLS